jgi:hypothetical protein
VALEVVPYDDRVRASIGEVSIEGALGAIREGRLALVAGGAVAPAAVRFAPDPLKAAESVASGRRPVGTDVAAGRTRGSHRIDRKRAAATTAPRLRQQATQRRLDAIATVGLAEGLDRLDVRSVTACSLECSMARAATPEEFRPRSAVASSA